jgi:hypothetical protein
MTLNFVNMWFMYPLLHMCKTFKTSADVVDALPVGTTIPTLSPKL